MQIISQFFFVFIAVFCLEKTFAVKEILGIIENADDLTPEEYNALHPFFVELQNLQDILLRETQNEINQNNNNNTINEYNQLYDQMFFDLAQQFSLNVEPKILNIDTKLPTVDELLDDEFKTKLSLLNPAEVNEYLEMRELLQEILDEAQQNINDIVKEAHNIERQIIEINKKKIIIYIYEGLKAIFKITSSGSRAAYCIYSHIPQLNSSLQDIYDGVDCYKYSLNIIATIENRTLELVNEIKTNILDIVRIFKNIAKKHTIIGKIWELMKNFFRISNDLFHSYLAAKKELNDMKELLPKALQHSYNCSSSFLQTIPYMIETVQNITTCLLYVPTTETYDFLKPENERI